MGAIETKSDPMEGSMNKQMRRRMLAMLAAVLMMISCAAQATTVFVMEDTTAYAKPDTSSQAYGTLEAGMSATLSDYGYGWAKITAGGKSAYVKADALAVQKSYSGQTVYTAGEAKMYRNLNESSAFQTLDKGTAVNLYATAGDWAYVKAGGSKGLVKISQLTTQGPEKEAPAQSVDAYVCVDGARAYKSNSTSSKVLCSLSLNDVVTVTAYKSGWCRVTKNGATGYMRRADLSTEKTVAFKDAGMTAYVTASSAKAYEQWSTSSSVVATVKQNTEVTVTGLSDDWARVKSDSGSAYMLRRDLGTSPVTPSNGSSATPARGTAKEIDWWDGGIQSLIKVGDTYTVTDVATGIAWTEKRVGGSNHCDTVPATKADTAAMKAACGSWSWDRRAVFVTVNGVNYAGSINCMPHGANKHEETGFGGHHCLHFTNSRTHGSDSLCPQHQAAIKKAASATLK